MYNKYGRDIGPEAEDDTTGTQRLISYDSCYATFYQDMINAARVCSGSMLVNNISKDNRIHLGSQTLAKTMQG